MGDDYIDIPLSSIGGDRPHLQLQPNWPSLAPNTNFPINSYSLNSPYCNTLYTNTLYRVLSLAYTVLIYVNNYTWKYLKSQSFSI